jgi:hypothetical protein
MSLDASAFDPWGPVSSIFYEINNSDFVKNAIARTGLSVEWHPLTPGENYSHGTRIRAMREDIETACSKLSSEYRGLLAQVVVKAMLQRHDGVELRAKLVDLLENVGWTISGDGALTTNDALLTDPNAHPEEPQRNPFQRDYDRIVFSSAFRRLQNKTQVHPFPTSDYVRRRLTHSLEVSCVGRSLGTHLGQALRERPRLSSMAKERPDLAAEIGQIVSAACLAHDIGNPPFGHAGEQAKVFDWERTITIEISGARMLEGLLDDLMTAAAAPQKFIHEKLLKLVPRFAPEAEPYDQLLSITDFVAGMTDSYLLQTHQKTRGLALGD